MPDLINTTSDYYEQLAKQGDLFDNETVNDKQLLRMQKPVLSASDYVMRHTLKRAMYLSKWQAKNDKRRDKWANSDARRADKRARRQFLRDRARTERSERKRAFKAWWDGVRELRRLKKKDKNTP